MIMQLLRTYIAGLSYEDLLKIGVFTGDEIGRRMKIRAPMHSRPALNKTLAKWENIKQYRDSHEGLTLVECKHVIEYWWDKE